MTTEEEDDRWLMDKTIAMLQYMIAYDIIAGATHVLVMQRCRRLLIRLGVRPVTATGQTMLEKKWEKLRGKIHQPEHNRMRGSEAAAKSHNAFADAGAVEPYFGSARGLGFNVEKDATREG